MLSATLFFTTSVLILLLLTYPLFSWLRTAIFPNPVKKNLSFRPAVSIVISCYNEERYIAERLNALLAPEDWIPGSEILIVSTGSTDRTNNILKAYENHPSITVYYEERITKIEALNKVVQLASNDYLIFSDCRQSMKPGSIPLLLANLADPDVGTVSCTILDTAKTPSFFRRLYLRLAIQDSKSGSAFNLYGALYAQRKDCFREIPTDLLFDDFFVAVSTLAQQKRLIQEKDALLYDVPFPQYYSAERVERLARGLLIFLFGHFQLIRKISFRLRMRLLIYKYLKLLLPLLVGIQLIAAAIYFKDNLFQEKSLFIVAGTVAFIMLIRRLRKFSFLLLHINYHFLAALIGFVFLNRRSKYWQPLTIRRKWFPIR